MIASSTVYENKVYLYSAPGRTELGGNHTDHQHGSVLAAAVDLDTRAEVTLNSDNVIRIRSEGFPYCEISLSQLAAREEERNTTASLVRGVAFGFSQEEHILRGFDADVSSSVLPGSGLSSSAAFEVLIGTIINHLSGCGKTPTEIARIAQRAENDFFGKPCGLMDQMTSAVGGCIAIDFHDPDNAVITPVLFDFSTCGYTLCIIDTGADHADLTEEYAAIPLEMNAVARFFGQDCLRNVEEEHFYRNLAELRRSVGDRAILRSIHFFEEDKRVERQVKALNGGDFEEFLRCVNSSGSSSWRLLQNITSSKATSHQDVAFTLALARKLLCGKGACRVHGGGFAGTVQAFVPDDALDDFRAGIEDVLGEKSCHALSVRGQGGVFMGER